MWKRHHSKRKKRLNSTKKKQEYKLRGKNCGTIREIHQYHRIPFRLFLEQSPKLEELQRKDPIFSIFPMLRNFYFWKNFPNKILLIWVLVTTMLFFVNNDDKSVLKSDKMDLKVLCSMPSSDQFTPRNITSSLLIFQFCSIYCL